MNLIETVANLIIRLAAGIPTTLVFIVIAWILGSLLAILVTAGRLSRHKLIYNILSVYISFTRSIPIILQLFLVYYGLPALLSEWGIDLSSVGKLVFCVVAYVIYYGAYLSEVLRPAYLSISETQREAALAAGYTRWAVETKIIIPQVIPVALPALGNEAINLVHQSSILFVIGVTDLMGQADGIVNEDYTVSPILAYFVAGLIYWVLTIVIVKLVKLVEHRAGRFLTTTISQGRAGNGI